MNPRDILELLLERLEPEVGHLKRVHFAAWVGSEDEARMNENLASGRLHLARAVLAARAALATNDDARIVDAAMMCASLERTGRAIADARRQMATVRHRKAGGARRGADQAAAAAKMWKPWVEKYQSLLAAGINYLDARNQVKDSMVDAGFCMPGSDAFPSDAAIRKWLPRKNGARS
jgi:hypothetical protein